VDAHVLTIEIAVVAQSMERFFYLGRVVAPLETVHEPNGVHDDHAGVDTRSERERPPYRGARIRGVVEADGDGLEGLHQL
jgi:hypothetical protein